MSNSNVSAGAILRLRLDANQLTIEIIPKQLIVSAHKEFRLGEVIQILEIKLSLRFRTRLFCINMHCKDQVSLHATWFISLMAFQDKLDQLATLRVNFWPLIPFVGSWRCGTTSECWSIRAKAYIKLLLLETIFPIQLSVMFDSSVNAPLHFCHLFVMANPWHNMPFHASPALGRFPFFLKFKFLLPFSCLLFYKRLQTWFEILQLVLSSIAARHHDYILLRNLRNFLQFCSYSFQNRFNLMEIKFLPIS